jgi:L-ascorbate metabolism protein UlaG (beta-lactamase superfamily)
MPPKKQTVKKVAVTWLGHAAFLFESPNGTRVVVDPWIENPLAPPMARNLGRIDVILVTHGHFDHIGNTLELAIESKAAVVSIAEIANYLQSRGIANPTGMNKGGTLEVKGLRVTMVDAKHSSDIEVDGKTISGGEAAGFVIEFEDGSKFYHAGDTSVFGDMKIIGDLYRPDVAILPIGGHFTMGPREAAYACGLLRPKRIIGMHYGTFPVLSGTPAELRKFLPASMKKNLVILEPGKPVNVY